MGEGKKESRDATRPRIYEKSRDRNNPAESEAFRDSPPSALRVR